MRPSPDKSLPGPRSRKTLITMAGLLYGLTTLFLAVGAVNGQNNLLFLAFGLTLGGLLVSGVFSGSGMMGLRLARRVASQARAGEPLAIHYDVANTNRLMRLFCVTISERGLEASALTRDVVAFLPGVGARGQGEAMARAVPRARGRLTLSRIVASSSFPFGLMRKAMTFPSDASVLVLPARLRLRESILPRPARRGHGASVSPTGAGSGEDFFGVRAYVAGDSPRLIAWRPSARGEELIVRQQGTPPPTVAWVSLDVHPDAPALENERAIALAGALAELLADRGCSVGLVVRWAGLVRAPAPGGWHARRLLGLLALLRVEKQPPESARGAPATMPRILREHAVISVRATRAGTDAGAAPAWATRLESARIADYLGDGQRLPEVLSEPKPPESSQERWRRVMREFFLVDPVGESAMAGGGESGAGVPRVFAGSGRAAGRPPAIPSGRAGQPAPGRGVGA